jgi:hypothetical protein
MICLQMPSGPQPQNQMMQDVAFSRSQVKLKSVLKEQKRSATRTQTRRARTRNGMPENAKKIHLTIAHDTNMHAMDEQERDASM